METMPVDFRKKL